MEWLKLASSSSFQPITYMTPQDLSITFNYTFYSGTNVLAMIPAQDASSTTNITDETIVITAHIDHLGVKNGSVYPGSVDDASGASMLLVLASAMSQTISPKSLIRSIVFLWPTAEESGLIGSQHWVDHPTVSWTPVANMNFDVGNVWGLTQDFTILGQDKSTLGDMLSLAASQQSMFLSPDPTPSTGLFFRSDHFSFAKSGIPAVWVYTGSHFVGQPSDFYNVTISQGYYNTNYHQTTDVYQPSFLMGGMIQMLCLTSQVTLNIATILNEVPTCYNNTCY